jgi:hypothetical protein
MILITAYERDKYTNTAYSMFGKTVILRAVILQRTEAVAKQTRINKRIFVKSIIWKFKIGILVLLEDENLL